MSKIDLTVRKKKFVAAKLKGASNTQAALAAVPNITPQSAKTIGMRLSTSVDVQESITNALEKHNLTIDRLLNKIEEKLEAKKPIVMGKRDSQGDDTFVDYIDDNTAQLKAVDMCLKLLLFTAKVQAQRPDLPAAISPQVLEAIKGGDVSEIQRIIFGGKADVDAPKLENKNVAK